jgi:hypothetical protein
MVSTLFPDWVSAEVSGAAGELTEDQAAALLPIAK